MKAETRTRKGKEYRITLSLEEASWLWDVLPAPADRCWERHPKRRPFFADFYEVVGAATAEFADSQRTPKKKKPLCPYGRAVKDFYEPKESP